MPLPETDRRPPDWRAYLAAYARAWHQFHDRPTQPQNTLQILQAGEGVLVRELLKPGKFARSANERGASRGGTGRVG